MREAIACVDDDARYRRAHTPDWVEAKVHPRRESNIIPSVFRMHACSAYLWTTRFSWTRRHREAPNGIANPIQETSGTNGGSMFYRYCNSRKRWCTSRVVVYVLLRVLSAVCKRIYGLAFVYRRPCYHFPHRRLALFLPGRFADAVEGIKMSDPRKNGEDRRLDTAPVHVLCRDFSLYVPVFLSRTL